MWRWWVCCNLKREAAPLATQAVVSMYDHPLYVAISSEKPLPWRLVAVYRANQPVLGCNLKREAAPLATSFTGEKGDID